MLVIKEVKNYKKYGKCVSISNGIIETLITIDLGPRIISFSFVGKNNILHSDREEFAPMGGKAFDNHYFKGAAWESFGGHRLWIAPESLPETYNPDIESVKYEVSGNAVKFIQVPQTANGIQISFEIIMDEDLPSMTIKHYGKNITDAVKNFALWPITVMAKGGVEIIPLNTNDAGLLPNRNITFWSYSKINDKRLNITDKYITLKQDPTNTDAFKIGTDCNAGLGYYVLGNTVFSKEYTHVLGGNYVDCGASYESYTNETILEFETLSELKSVKPNEQIEHIEKFNLYKANKELDLSSDDSITKFISELK